MQTEHGDDDLSLVPLMSGASDGRPKSSGWNPQKSGSLGCLMADAKILILGCQLEHLWVASCGLGFLTAECLSSNSACLEREKRE